MSDRLRAFMEKLLDERERSVGGDLDGGWLQDTLIEYGFLVEIEVTEPCGELCFCAEWDDFPQTCVRRAEDALAAGKEEG